jgi:hypothetical protein
MTVYGVWEALRARFIPVEQYPSEPRDDEQSEKDGPDEDRSSLADLARLLGQDDPPL